MTFRKRLWTADDDAALAREIIAGKSLNEIAVKIGRTEAAVKYRVHVLGLTLKRRRSKPTKKARAAAP